MSIALNIIVSVLASASLVDETFSILGFMKSACPNSNDCKLLVLFDSSFNVSPAISILVVPLHSKNCLSVCFSASSQFDNVNVYLIPYVTVWPFLVSVSGVASLKDFWTFAVDVTSSPSIVTLILSVVKLLLA